MCLVVCEIGDGYDNFGEIWRGFEFVRWEVWELKYCESVEKVVLLMGGWIVGVGFRRIFVDVVFGGREGGKERRGGGWGGVGVMLVMVNWGWCKMGWCGLGCRGL